MVSLTGFFQSPVCKCHHVSDGDSSIPSIEFRVKINLSGPPCWGRRPWRPHGVSHVLLTALLPPTVDQLRPADSDEQKTPAAVQSAAAAAADLPASSHESPDDAKAAGLSDEPFQLPADRYERNVPIHGKHHASATAAACAFSHEWQSSWTIPREIHVILH